MRYQQLIAASQPLLAVGAVIHAQPEARGIDNTQPAGENPIKSFHTEYLGTQLSANSCNARDLGFAGHIQGKWYGVYGDNLGCAPGVHDPDKSDHQIHAFVRDSAAALTNNPLLVVDQNLDSRGYPQQFTPWIKWWGETAETGFGGTSIVETDWDSATGAVYYLIVRKDTLQCAHQLFFRPPIIRESHAVKMLLLTRGETQNRTSMKTTLMQESARSRSRMARSA